MSRSSALGLVLISLAAFADDGDTARQQIMKRLKIEARAQPDAGAIAAAEPGTFESIRPIIQRRCASCHRSGGMAAGSGWTLVDAEGPDAEATKKVAALLLLKGTGSRTHGGGAAIAAGSPEALAIQQWADGIAPVEVVVPAARANGPITFASVERVLETKCAGCHQAGGLAANSGWLLTRVSAVDEATTRRHGDLLQKATGQRPHGGGAVLTRDSVEYAVILKWFDTGPRAAPPMVVEAIPEVIDAGLPIADIVDAGTPSFDAVHVLLISHCAGCHAEGQMAGASRYRTNSDPFTHFTALQPVLGIVAQRARGESHAGGIVLAPPELDTLTRWLASGANGPTAASAPQPVATPAPRPAVEAGFIWARLPILGTFRLNGRFDLSLERTGYNTNPFVSTAKTGLQSYHHFLFLSRESADDPFSISVEVTSLQFWHVGARISPEAWPIQLSAKAGKLLVPFGGEPLYHHSYGGTAGFDQRVLPPIFAREGFSLSASARTHGVAFTADLYLIAGYGLRAADAVLNLQSDLTPLDAIHPAVGARAGAAWGPLSIWYSALINPLGFDRRLFMQSVDVALFRPKIKVLEYFSFGVGLLRADVSGGGPGEDYFHFASYFEVRAYPVDWLYVQYRQGLRTFNNRRGVFLDQTRLTSLDSSTHNFGIVARWRGLSVGLYQFFNFEKVDETPNDVTRLMVAYDF